MFIENNYLHPKYNSRCHILFKAESMAMHFSVLKSNKDNPLSDLGPRSVLRETFWRQEKIHWKCMFWEKRTTEHIKKHPLVSYMSLNSCSLLKPSKLETETKKWYNHTKLKCCSSPKGYCTENLTQVIFWLGSNELTVEQCFLPLIRST